MFPHELSVHVSFEPPSLKQHMTLRNMQSRNTTVLSKFFVKLVLVGKARTGCRCHFSALRVCLLRVDIRAVFQRASVSPSPNCGVWFRMWLWVRVQERFSNVQSRLPSQPLTECAVQLRYAGFPLCEATMPHLTGRGRGGALHLQRLDVLKKSSSKNDT